MADVRENNLATLSYTLIADGDFWRIIDTSSGESKKVTASELKQYILGASTAINWNDVSGKKELVTFCVAMSNEGDAISTGTAKVTWRAPFAFTFTNCRASCNTAPTGAAITIDINEAGTTLLSTKLTIAAGSKTSVGGTPHVISDSTIPDDGELTFDFDTVGSGVAGKGVKVYLFGYRMIDGL